MKNTTTVSSLPSLASPLPRPRLPLVFMAAATSLLLLLTQSTIFAGSATWRHSPPQRHWHVATSWTPETVPNGPNDTATFAVSISDPSISGVDIEVNGIVFDPSASDFTINVVPNTGQAASLTLSGAGITNNSGITQDFTAYTNGYTNGTISFTNNATAGSFTIFFNYGGYNAANGAVTQFFDNATAGGGIFTNLGGSNLSAGTTQFFENSTAANGTFTNYGGYAFGGTTQFFDNSTAANGSFTNTGGSFNGYVGGNTFFYHFSTAGNGMFINNGGAASGASGGSTDFVDTSTAGNATLIANGSTVSDAQGGRIRFFADSDGVTARVKVFDNGFLDISAHTGGVEVGSLEGSGLVFLGHYKLTVGKNGLSTVFSGVIQDGGFSGGTGGSLIKIGMDALVLTNANTYSGGTTLRGGPFNNGRAVLEVDNTSGSGTGSGPVVVRGGALRGTGIIAGPVTVSGSHNGPVNSTFLYPGKNGFGPGTLTIQNTLTLGPIAAYQVSVKNNTATKVVANGVAINGAQLAFTEFTHQTLTPGTVFTIISNTAATPIAGTFSNVPDGTTFNRNGNSYHVDYEGGDGNDLTLTVVP